MINIPKTNEQIDQWRSVMFLYDSALKKMNTKIEILNNEFINRYDYNPIEHIKSRLKTADSIVNKLKKDGREVSIENMQEYLSDIAGIRIICSFTSDIYQIAQIIAGQRDVTVLHVKDYIKYPKPNGYKSYHMVALISVRLWIFDIVLYMKNRNIPLPRNNLSDLINIGCKGADNADTRNIAQILLHIFNAYLTPVLFQFIYNAVRCLQP